MIKYKVGQILYSILEEKQVIIPIRVVEEITIKNEEGEETNYKVAIPNNKNQKVKLSIFNKVFLDLDEVSNFLVSNAKEAIEKMVEDAIYLEEDFFKAVKVEKSLEVDKANIEDTTCNDEKNNVKISLGDGKVANFNVDSINNIEKK
jgi:hypothetical protein